jgi:hypothetical protein
MPIDPLKPPSIPATHPAEPTAVSPEAETPEPPDLPPIGPENVIKCQNSSMVHSFEYNKGDQTLRVYFRGGQIYDYFFVPEHIADEFKHMCEEPSESAGKWFAKNVRKTFEFQKIA